MINFKELAVGYKDEALNCLMEILSINTVLDEYDPNSKYPFGKGNFDCLNYMLNKGVEEGFLTVNIENYAGHIEYGTKGKILGVLGHLDVVPATGNWKFPPFTPTVENGKLYARGALDDKGAVVACYYAMKIIKDMGCEINNTIRLIMGCDEESGSRCLDKYLAMEKMPDYGFSPDADFPLIYGEKGILSFDISGSVELGNLKSIKCGTRYNLVPDCVTAEFFELDVELFKIFLNDNNYQGSFKDNSVTLIGKSAHAMQPHIGVNAGVMLMEFINLMGGNKLSDFVLNSFDCFGEKLGLKLHDDQMGDLTVNLGIMNYDGSTLKLGYNCRLPKDDHALVVKEKYDDYASEFGLKVENFNYSKSHYVDPNSNLVKTLVSSYQQCYGDFENKPFTIGGGTYARAIKNAVAFGPMFLGREDVVHQPDEYIFISDFVKWIEIYAHAIYELVK